MDKLKNFLQEKKEKKVLSQMIKSENPDPRVRNRLIDDLYEKIKQNRKK